MHETKPLPTYAINPDSLEITFCLICPTFG